MHKNEYRNNKRTYTQNKKSSPTTNRAGLNWYRPLKLFLVMVLLSALVITPQFAGLASAQDDSGLATATAETNLSNQFGRTIISARGNHFVIDSAPPLGHPAEELNPVEAMFAALATCGLFVYEAAAQEMDIPLDSATVTVEGDFDARGLVGEDGVNPRVQAFRVHIDVEGPNAEQLDALEEQWMTRCPAYTTFVKAAPITITTNDEEMGGPSAEGLATPSVTASLFNQPGRAVLTVRDNYMVVDSVPPLGGPNLEMNPLDLLLGAQGSCGAVIFENAAIAQNIPFEGVKGVVEVDFDPQGLIDGSVDPAIQVIRVNWEIDTDTEENAAILLDEWVQRCPIYNTLVRATDVEITHKLAGQGEVLLSITFNYDLPADEFQAEVAPLVPDYAALEGMLWKIWSLDEENSEFNATFVFEDADAMQAFLDGELAATVMSHPAVSNFEASHYNIMQDETRGTFGPVR